MKRISVILIALALCLCLCACGRNAESIELPTKPTQSVSAENQSPAQVQSTQPQDSSDSAESQNPWEVEFREEDYEKFNFTAPNGDKIITWREGGMFGQERRCLYEWAENGNIEDAYYYPSGNTSHSYMWYADGSYQEQHFLDNGYTDIEAGITYTGTVVYFKHIGADGSETEQHTDENGVLLSLTNKAADGTYSESQYFENGNQKTSIYTNPTTGETSEYEYYENGSVKYTKSQTPETISEWEYFENGNIKISVYHNLATEEYFEQEYYENGSLKRNKNQTAETLFEEELDTDGFRTYCLSQHSNWEVECIADDTGKLVKVIENGTEILDSATLTRYAMDYNFRS